MPGFQIQDSLPLMIRDEMGISQCHGDALMAKKFLDDQYWLPRNGKPTSKRVSQIMEGDFLSGIGNALIEAKLENDFAEGLGNGIDLPVLPVIFEDKFIRTFRHSHLQHFLD